MALKWTDVVQDPSWNSKTPDQQVNVANAYMDRFIKPSPEWRALAPDRQEQVTQNFLGKLKPAENVGLAGAFVQGARESAGSTLEGLGALTAKVTGDNVVTEGLESAGQAIEGEQLPLSGIGEKLAFGLGNISVDIATAFIPVGGAVGVGLKTLSRVPRLAKIGLAIGKVPLLAEFGKSALTFAGVGAIKGAPEDEALSQALQNAALSVPFGLSALPARFLAKSLRGAVGMGLVSGATVGAGTALAFGGDEDDIISNALLFAGLNAVPNAKLREKIRKKAEGAPDMSVGDLLSESAKEFEAVGDKDAATAARNYREDLNTSYHLRPAEVQARDRTFALQSLNELRPAVQTLPEGSELGGGFDRAFGEVRTGKLDVTKKTIRDHSGEGFLTPKVEPQTIIGLERPGELGPVTGRLDAARRVPGVDRTARDLLEIDSLRRTREARGSEILVPDYLRRKLEIGKGKEAEPFMQEVSDLMQELSGKRLEILDGKEPGPLTERGKKLMETPGVAELIETLEGQPVNERAVPSKEASTSQMVEITEDVVAVEKPAFPSFGERALEFTKGELSQAAKDETLRGPVTPEQQAIVDTFRATQGEAQALVKKAPESGQLAREEGLRVVREEIAKRQKEVRDLDGVREDLPDVSPDVEPGTGQFDPGGDLNILRRAKAEEGAASSAQSLIAEKSRMKDILKNIDSALDAREQLVMRETAEKNAKLAAGEKVSYTQEERDLMAKRTTLRKMAEGKKKTGPEEMPFAEEVNMDALDADLVDMDSLLDITPGDDGFTLGMSAGAVSIGKVWDTVKPFIKELIPLSSLYKEDMQAHAKQVVKDSSRGVARRFRQPFWVKELEPISEYLVKHNEDIPAEFTSRANALILHLQKLPKTVQDAAAKLRYDLLDPEAPEFGPLLKTKKELELPRGKKQIRYREALIERKIPEPVIEGFMRLQNWADFMYYEVVGDFVRDGFPRLSKAKIREFVPNWNPKTEGMDIAVEKYMASHYVQGYLPTKRLKRFVLNRRVNVSEAELKGNPEARGEVVYTKDFGLREQLETFKESQAYEKAAEERYPGDWKSKDGAWETIDTRDTAELWQDSINIGRHSKLLEALMDQTVKEGGYAGEELQAVLGNQKLIMDTVKSEYMRKFAQGSLARKRNVPGFSRDYLTAINAYNKNFPKALSRWFSQPELAKLVRKIPVEGQKRAMAQNMVDFYQGRKNPEGKLNTGMRQALYMYYLIAKPAFGALNIGQRIFMTLPWAHHLAKTEVGPKGQTLADNAYVKANKFWGAGQVDELLLLGKLTKNRFGRKVSERKAFDKIVTEMQREKREKAGGVDVWKEEAAHLRTLHRRGELQDMRLVDITGKENSWARKLDIFGVYSERSNRIHATLMGTKMYKELGFSGPELTTRVERFVHKTQNMYGKANRAEIARGGMAVPFVFKSYIMNYLEMQATLMRKSPAAFMHSMALMLAGAGAAGLYPEELEKVIDYFAINKMKYFDWPLRKQQWAEKLRDNRVLEAVTYGIPSLLGIDGTSVLGLNSFTSVAITPIAQGLINLPKNLAREDMSISDKMKVFWPTQGKKMLTVWKIMKHGRGENQPTTPQGKPYITEREINRIPPELRDVAFEVFDKLPRDYGTWTKIVTALGFPATALSQYYDGARALKETARIFSGKKAEFHRAIGKAMANDDWILADQLEDRAARAGLALDTTAILNAEQDFLRALGR